MSPDFLLPDATALALDQVQRAPELITLTALRLPWSNGPVEGQGHRLKLLKRQMFGRAKFDLLRGRVLFRA